MQERSTPSFKQFLPQRYAGPCSAPARFMCCCSPVSFRILRDSFSARNLRPKLTPPRTIPCSARTTGRAPQAFAPVPFLSAGCVRLSWACSWRCRLTSFCSTRVISRRPLVWTPSSERDPAAVTDQLLEDDLFSRRRGRLRGYGLARRHRVHIDARATRLLPVGTHAKHCAGLSTGRLASRPGKAPSQKGGKRPDLVSSFSAGGSE